MFPPAPSLRLTKDVILFTTKNVPKWNPMNVCSYHLQEAGATPVQELSYALAIAIAVLDTVRDDPEFDAESFSDVFGRISFFVNAGLRFVTEICKMRRSRNSGTRSPRALRHRRPEEAHLFAMAFRSTASD